jgi:hypothetical protein
LTDRVTTTSEGVRVQVRNRSGEPVSINGIGLDFSPGVPQDVAGVEPGHIGVACWPYSRHRGNEPKTLPLEVVDPEGFFTEPSIECPPGDEIEAAIYDFLSGRRGREGDPIVVARSALPNIREDDKLEQVAYAGAEEATVAVVRDGRTVATISLTRAEGGSWLVGGYYACASSGL